jgi:UDP-N-acetylmuramoylalanine--D-glutamate ligase
VRAEEVAGKRFSIIGAARSGLAVAGLLVRSGGIVFVSDNAGAARMADARMTLDRIGVQYEFGGNTDRVLDADVVVLSPGVPSTAGIVQKALQRGRVVVSELEASSWFCRSPIVAITGTNGKTTTTTLTGRMFEDARRQPIVAGNIGTAFAELAQDAAGDRPVVLEVSSFQLDHIDTFRPRIAVILNITPDHLDRYDHSFARYTASKCRIFKNQGAGDTLLYNSDDAVTTRAVMEHVSGGVTLLPFSVHTPQERGAWVENGVMMENCTGIVTPVVPVADMSLRGMHNQYNAMASVLAARVLGVPIASIRSTLKNFKGVEHRLEVVRERNGVTFVNDSKATNVDSVWYALQSYDSPLVVLIGGRDKGNDYARLYELVKKHVRCVVAIGESAAKVIAAFEGLVPVVPAGSMAEAVRVAAAHAEQGDVVLLSPACASFDWFDNYEHRGRTFKELVMTL